MLSLPLIVVSILISRLSTIALIPCIIYLCLASRDHKNKKKLLILAGSIIFVSLVYILIIFGSSYRPPVNTTYESLFYNLEDEPILSLWGEGHIINMFHSPGAIYKASPSKENLIIIVKRIIIKRRTRAIFFLIIIFIYSVFILFFNLYKHLVEVLYFHYFFVLVCWCGLLCVF